MPATDDPPGETPSRGRKRNAERTKREILTAAGRLFARSGYSRVSLQEIAAEVGVTAAMINHHFGSKLELFGAVARDEWDLQDRIETLPSDDVASVARSLVRHWTDRDARSPAVALVRSLDNEEALELLRGEFDRRLRVPWAGRIQGPDAELRLKLIEGVVAGFGFFTTGALLDPGTAPFGDEEIAGLEKYLARLLAVLDNPDAT